MWEPFDTYHKAIYEEGKLTLSVVTKHLYTGDNISPDIYFKTKFGAEKYKCIFNGCQRSVLERYMSSFFNIRTAVGDYDISLHYLLQEYVCGLSPKGDINWKIPGTLENLLSQVHQKRNEVSHDTWPMSEHDLNGKLVELRKLYVDIIDHVDRRSRSPYSIDEDKSRIMEGLKRKFPSNVAAMTDYGRGERGPRLQNLNRLLNQYSSNHSSMSNCERKEEESSVLKTFGKIALGAASVAAITYGAVSLMNNNEDNKKEDEKKRSHVHRPKEKKQSSEEEECCIM